MNQLALALAALARVILLVLIGIVSPTIWRETNVGNGLGRLRRMIFLGIVSYCFANLALLIFQIYSMFFEISKYATDLATIINSCATIIVATILHLIYSDRYKRLVKKHEHKK